MTPLCVICTKRPQRSKTDSFCKPCGDEFANDMAEIDRQTNIEACIAITKHAPAKYFEAAEPSREDGVWGRVCSEKSCGHCGACT